MKKIHWCNDKPLANIILNLLENNNWSAQNNKRLFLNNRWQYLSEEVKKFQFTLTPKLTQYSANPLISANFPPNFSSCSRLLFSNLIKCDILATKKESLLAVEIKSRLFPYIIESIKKKKDSIDCYDQFHIKYHFDDFENAISAYANLVFFNKIFNNQKKSSIARFENNYEEISESCELLRYCLALADSPDIDHKLYNAKYVVLFVPDYIQENQMNQVKTSLKNLQSFCKKNKIEVTLGLIQFKKGDLVLDNDNNAQNLFFNPNKQHLDPGNISIQNVDLNNGFPFEDLFSVEQNLQNLNNNAFRSQFVTNKTKWASCNECIYWKKYCAIKS